MGKTTGTSFTKKLCVDLSLKMAILTIHHHINF